MKTLYLECNMGAAGDMLTAALFELTENKMEFISKMNSLGIPGVKVSAEPSKKCGINGTHISVAIDGEEEIVFDHDHGEHHHHHDDEEHHHHDHDMEHHHHEAHHHHHTGMHEIEHLLSHLDLPEKVRADALEVYKEIAEAESRAHGVSVEQIHFHEVGTLDAVADVVGVCMLIDMLKPERIVASPVHVGCGEVHCAHGILPVPAPATAYLLRGIPTYGGSVRGELCTPTGAALLRHFASDFGDMPIMRVDKIGYGMGAKDFDAANCVRAMLGDSESGGNDRVLELCCNIDDMTPEAIAFACEKLMSCGAKDVFTTAIGMKKNRPAVFLTCICENDNREKMVKEIFSNTTTLGIREHICNRYVLLRREKIVSTELGDVRVKYSEGFGVKRRKIEYEDAAKIAREKNIPLGSVIAEIEKQL